MRQSPAEVALEWLAAEMTRPGQYGDGRTYPLPADWQPVSTAVVEVATERTLDALTGDQAREALAQYYDPSKSYAGTLFLDAVPNDPDNVEAADLYALTTLNITLDARQGRLLLAPGHTRQVVHQHLNSLPIGLAITDFAEGEGGSPATLTRMYALHSQFRDLLAGNSNRWVTAAKLCARKRPTLFPVRDNLVCQYLGGGEVLKPGTGRPGTFSIDLQLYAYLMTHRDVADALKAARADLDARRLPLDAEDLRLLDSALWMAAKRTSA